jgi:acyl carrier protein
MFGIEKWIFQVFPKMPRAVRVFTYLVILALFVYLVLIPRFVDGQLVVKEAGTGGMLPYRGADLQIQVDGRPYKFRTNEDGFFSIPVISRLPEGLEVQIFHADKQLWFPLELSTAEIWVRKRHRIEVLIEKPFVRLARTGEEPGTAHVIAGLLEWLASPALAQSIYLPKSSKAQEARLASAEKTAIQSTVESTYAKVAGKASVDVGPASPLTDGDRGLTYLQRIQLVTSLERTYGLTIPDEHWQPMTSVGQLVDYLEKRKQIEQALPSQDKSAVRSWPQIQQSFPIEDRPVYKK